MTGQKQVNTENGAVLNRDFSRYHYRGEYTPAESTNTPTNASYEPTEPHPEPIPRRSVRAVRDASIGSTITSGKAASIRACQTASERSSTSTLKPATNAKSSSPR